MNEENALKAAKKYLKQADKLHYKAKYKKEISFLNQALAIYEKFEKWEKYADVLNRLARHYIVLEKIPKAENYLGEILKIYSTYSSLKVSILATAYYHYSYIHGYIGENDEALNYLDKAMEIWNEFPDDYIVERSAAFNRKAMIAIEDSDFQLAIEVIQKNQEMLKKADLENHFEMAISIELYAEAAGYARIENTLTVLESYHEALRIKEAILPPKHPSVALTLYGIGTCYNEIQDVENARKYFYNALSIIEKKVGKKSIFYNSTLSGIATSYFNERNFEHALKLFQRVLAGYESMPYQNPILMGNVHYHLTACLTNLRKYEYQEGIERYQLAIASLNDPIHFALSYIYNAVGEWERVHENYQKALDHFQKAIDIGELHMGLTAPIVIHNYISLAEVLSLNQKYDEALEIFQQTFGRILLDYNNMNIYDNPIVYNQLHKDILLRGLMGKAAAFYEKYLHQSKNVRDLRMAFDTYETAHKLIDDWRRSYQGTSLMHRLAEQSQQVYEALLSTIYALCQEEEQLGREYIENLKRFAFECSEKNHNIFLLSSLKKEDAQIAANISEELLRKEKTLRYEMVLLEKKVEDEHKKKGDGKNLNVVLELQNEIFEKNQQYQELIREFEQKSPDYFQLKYDTTTATIEQIQSILEENTLLIEYFVGNKSIYAFVISQTDYQMVSLVQDDVKMMKELEETMDEYFKGFNEPFDYQSYYIEAAYELYSNLLAPILENSQTIFDLSIHQKVIFIPDDFLNTIPFEALLYEKVVTDSTSTYQDLPYLLHQFTSSYHYSATLLYYLQQKAFNASEVADTFIGFAPVYDNRWKKSTHSPFRSMQTEDVYIRGKKYQALPDSEKEIKGIKQIFQQRKSHQPEIYLRRKATLNRFLKKLQEPFKYIHVSAHTHINQDIPELSGIVLSPESNEKKGGNLKKKRIRKKKYQKNRENILRIANVYNLDLKGTDLVVASCCETGQGAFVQGEGIIALNRGFLYAGAKNVVYTLAKVTDRASCDLNIEFYSNFLNSKEHKSYAIALQKAKQALLNKSDIYAAPVFWAGFVLIETPV